MMKNMLYQPHLVWEKDRRRRVPLTMSQLEIRCRPALKPQILTVHRRKGSVAN
jgi:hypothetical protein